MVEQRSEKEIKLAVRKRYASAATGAAEHSCCASDYPADIPLAARNVSLGCGSPVSHAGIQPGQSVLDLGSGGGIDVFAASKLVGDAGRVVGVDATVEMVLSARETAREEGFHNVEFRLGEIEHLPVDSDSVDVVISNCVLNLVPDKGRAFAEIWRVLKRGGRLVVSDIVAKEEMPPEVKNDLEKWSECVSGAMTEEEIRRRSAAIGLSDFSVLEAGEWYEMGAGVPLRSLTFSSEKPAAATPGSS
jgi:SAM-dependent methyltransferase